MRKTTTTATAIASSQPRQKRRNRTKPSCETCYFGARMLCALELGAPCSTFRPNSPQGLTPPSQPMLLVGGDPTPSTSGLPVAV